MGPKVDASGGVRREDHINIRPKCFSRVTMSPCVTCHANLWTEDYSCGDVSDRYKTDEDEACAWVHLCNTERWKRAATFLRGVLQIRLYPRGGACDRIKSMK